MVWISNLLLWVQGGTKIVSAKVAYVGILLLVSHFAFGGTAEVDADTSVTFCAPNVIYKYDSLLIKHNHPYPNELCDRMGQLTEIYPLLKSLVPQNIKFLITSGFAKYMANFVQIGLTAGLRSQNIDIIPLHEIGHLYLNSAIAQRTDLQAVNIITKKYEAFGERLWGHFVDCAGGPLKHCHEDVQNNRDPYLMLPFKERKLIKFIEKYHELFADYFASVILGRDNALIELEPMDSARLFSVSGERKAIWIHYHDALDTEKSIISFKEFILDSIKEEMTLY